MPRVGTHVRQRWPIAVLAIFAIAGYLFVAASLSADGDDLRPTGGDPASLARERRDRIEERREDASHLRSDIDRLSASVKNPALEALRSRAKALEEPTGLTALEGPGMRVTLTDAPATLNSGDDVDASLLVHQQDIQAYVNALWAGGAEAVTLQGQRLISTTGIKCVGATVVLDGVPYSPPYVIEAIGDVQAMNDAINTSSATITYATYAQSSLDPSYQLGLDIENVANVKAEAYAGPVSLRYAKAN